MFRYPILWAIRFYQKTFSPDHGLVKYIYPGGTCKFYPTCSEYGYQAVERFGIVKGGLLAAKRLFRCHPWSLGGVDEVPAR